MERDMLKNAVWSWLNSVNATARLAAYQAGFSPCSRCGGSGYVASFGVCFRCGGHGTTGKKCSKASRAYALRSYAIAQALVKSIRPGAVKPGHEAATVVLILGRHRVAA